MRKSNWTLALFIVLGLLAGSIVAGLAAGVPSVSFLTKSTDIAWQPKADLQFIRYDLQLHIKLNLLSLAGAAAAIWIYRKL